MRSTASSSLVLLWRRLPLRRTLSFHRRRQTSASTCACVQAFDDAMSTGEYRFYRHFDYGLLREGPEPLRFDMWQGDHWQAIILNPFTASMSPVPEAVAKLTAGDCVFGRPTHQERPGGKVEPINWDDG